MTQILIPDICIKDTIIHSLETHKIMGGYYDLKMPPLDITKPPDAGIIGSLTVTKPDFRPVLK